MKKSKGYTSKIAYLLKTYWTVPLVLLILAAIALSSLEIYKEEVLNIDPDIEYVEQDTLYFASERIDTLNPVISQSEDVYYLSKLIYSSLFTFDENLRVVPDLAMRYVVNTEKAYVEITLKNDVVWHNGKKLDAADVVFTINTMKYAGTSCPYYDKMKKINSAYIRDKNVVAVYFNNNYNCSLDDLVFPIIPAGQYNSTPLFASARDGFKPVGTGQYRYKSYNSLKQLKLVPNEDYYAEKAEKNITVTILPDGGLADNMMEINSVSCYVDTAANRKSSALDRNFRIYDIPSNNVEFIVFNTEKAPVSSKSFRHALAYGIDSEKILDNAYMGDGILTDTIYYPGFLGVEDTLDNYNIDINKAKSLLSGVGYKDGNGDGYIEGFNGSQVSLEILVNSENATRNSAAKIIKSNLEQIGINSFITSVPQNEYMAAIRNGKFDILITGYTISESYNLQFFFDRNSPWGYYNYDIYLKSRELERLYTPSEYKNKYIDIKEALIEELPYMPLCYKKISLIGVENFEAEKLPMFNNIYMNCSTWKWNKTVQKNDVEE